MLATPQKTFAAMLALCSLALPCLAEGSADAPVNSLETRQFHIENARLPGAITARQTVTAWQVSQGTWNGQTLDGLSIVLVLSTPESGQSAQTNCYISHEATAAQREALLTAFFASQPQLSTLRTSLRIEPAAISLEIDGQSIILHLGLIA